MVSIVTDVGVLGSGMLRELNVASGNAEGGKPRDGY
jgi:4-hydroxy-2-oxoheptanedioate aldolase